MARACPEGLTGSPIHAGRIMALAVALAVAGAGCSTSSPGGEPVTGAASAAASSGAFPSPPVAAGAIRVAASFYPLAYAVERVGGPRVAVTNLTRPGAEPHDVELTPTDVATIESAALVVYLKGFQPAVDEAVARRDSARTVEVSGPARLLSDGSRTDPHFWLDPTRYASVTLELARRLAELDPADATGYRQRGQALAGELAGLDRQFRAGLATCASRDLVTGHTAFGYLAAAYRFTQVGISGLSPEAEPDPASMARIASYVRTKGVTTVYTETLVSPAAARAVADEAGATLAVLDPLEGLAQASAGRDYLSVMRANLATLRAGQRCT
ncbi:MAG TPA: metal ABC transporter substrate-binding protein [Dermatophilaceae bacterium]|nr:metal ABC transporter substrate-binding protein [Dermatophilaceae bacterium]